MNSKHTPGPWRIDSGRHGIHIRAGKQTDPLGGDLVSATFNYANARLIAKAPAMHDVLRRVAEFWAGGDVPADLDRDIRALLED